MIDLRNALLLAALCLSILQTAELQSVRAAELLVEAESFADQGGWKLDTQFIQQMGSPYLLAHGLGKPVADATTEIDVAETGTYRVWVRTIDWVARWKAKPSPGKFQLSVNGKPLSETFGTQGADWTWHDGGTVQLSKGKTKLSLKDLTGFDGRCDCIFFTTDQDDNHLLNQKSCRTGDEFNWICRIPRLLVAPMTWSSLAAAMPEQVRPCRRLEWVVAWR